MTWSLGAWHPPSQGQFSGSVSEWSSHTRSGGCHSGPEEVQIEMLKTQRTTLLIIMMFIPLQLCINLVWLPSILPMNWALREWANWHFYESYTALHIWNWFFLCWWNKNIIWKLKLGKEDKHMVCFFFLKYSSINWARAVIFKLHEGTIYSIVKFEFHSFSSEIKQEFIKIKHKRAKKAINQATKNH